VELLGEEEEEVVLTLGACIVDFGPRWEILCDFYDLYDFSRSLFD
jgi:hypothetical protein